MIKEGSNLNTRDQWGNIPFHLVLKQGNLEIAELIMDKNGGVHTSDEFGIIPLHRALFLGYSEIEKKIIARGVDVREANI